MTDDQFKAFMNKPKEYFVLPNGLFGDNFGNVTDASSIAFIATEATAERDELRRRLDDAKEIAINEKAFHLDTSGTVAKLCAVLGCNSDYPAIVEGE